MNQVALEIKELGRRIDLELDQLSEKRKRGASVANAGQYLWSWSFQGLLLHLFSSPAGCRAVFHCFYLTKSSWVCTILSQSDATNLDFESSNTAHQISNSSSVSATKNMAKH